MGTKTSSGVLGQKRVMRDALIGIDELEALAELNREGSASEVRIELDRRHRSYSQMARPWLMVAVGVAFGLPIVTWPIGRGRSPADVAPFVVIMVVWLVVSWYARNRQARQIEREINELNQFEQEN